jgi:(p)ppGpp synthase/HD superfamily hydrolase
MEHKEYSYELEKAFAFAKEKHGEQMYGAFPYTYHLIEVCNKVEEMGLPTEYQMVALLHDTLEDTDTTWTELRQKFGGFIGDAVFFMSKKDTETYENYLDNLIFNTVSKQVKICDLLCNLKNSYLMEDCERKDKLITKYEKALFILGSGG